MWRRRPTEVWLLMIGMDPEENRVLGVYTDWAFARAIAEAINDTFDMGDWIAHVSGPYELRR